MEQLSKISVQEYFWVRVQQHQLNFGYKGLPPDVHFTIAYNHNSSNVNLHLTRNVPDVELHLRPRIDIAIISKLDLDKFGKDVPLRMLRLMLEPFDIAAFKAKHGNEIGFLSYEGIGKGDEYALIRKKLSDDFKQIAKPRGKAGIKVHGPIIETMVNFSTSKEMQDYVFNNTVELPDHFEKRVDGGMLFTSHEVVHVIRDSEHWFKIRENISPLLFLQAFVKPMAAKRIINYINQSVVRIESANTILDTACYNNPIHLVGINPHTT